MKLTKKLLTVLPLATLGAITPIVVSGCSCGTSYSISYGDAINCINKDGKNFHSIDEVKNSSKNHMQFFEGEKSADELIKFNDVKYQEKNQQIFYWDLIYSVASENRGFSLTWTLNSTKKALTEGKFNEITFTELTYAFDSDNKVVIQANGTSIVKSQAYSSVIKK